MKSVEIRPVQSRREKRIFLLFPWQIYCHDPLWVPPLLPDRKKTLDPKQGIFFQRGEAECFIAWQEGKPVGTICCAIDYKTNAQRGRKDAIFGFFECVEDEDVARALLGHAVQWGRTHGMTALDGPFHLDFENAYGILVEGRERPPALMCGHTPVYYQGYVERFGFQPVRGQNLAFAIDIREDRPELQRLSMLAEKVRQKGKVTVRAADFERWDEEVDNLHYLLNHALTHLPDHRPWQREVVDDSFRPFRSLADPELILFADVEGKTVGFLPALPNYNEAFHKVNGLRYPWDYARLWWAMRGPFRSGTIKSVLVLPEYWGFSGVAVLLMDEMVKRLRKRGYSWVDLSLTSADNPFTPDLATRLGAQIYKRFQVYRLELD
jgi:GNAT superfamily N-acetyltransferase